MQIGMIGLGRMGANMARRLLNGGHQCVVFDRSPKAVTGLTEQKAIGASSNPKVGIASRKIVRARRDRAGMAASSLTGSNETGMAAAVLRLAPSAAAA